MYAVASPEHRNCAVPVYMLPSVSLEPVHCIQSGDMLRVTGVFEGKWATVDLSNQANDDLDGDLMFGMGEAQIGFVALDQFDSASSSSDEVESSSSSSSSNENGFSLDNEYAFVETLPDQRFVYALVEFSHSVLCPLNSTIIASRLELINNPGSCRLAFSGSIVEAIKDMDEFKKQVKIYKEKERTAKIARIVDTNTLIGQQMFHANVDMNTFSGKTVERTLDGSVGVIRGSFGKGTQNKFKVWFAGGTSQEKGGTLVMKYKRNVFDKDETWLQ
eukprot:TRINITY_DN318_c0_g3_i1.p1 TRINITY_DN318_c0_g3~~TRINITY_DN318_c0_g3_i1.p1  ORF type:complete len:319 (-),score=118.76 TRINITY_DN318_c0_g3_i1:506-1327(-)